MSSSRMLRPVPQQFWPRGDDPDVLLRQRLGPALLYWWEPREELITVPEAVRSIAEGTTIDSIKPLAGNATMGSRIGLMPFMPEGGPGGRPYIGIPLDGNNELRATISIATGNRAALYCVARFNGVVGPARNVFRTITAGALTGSSVQTVASANQFLSSMRFTSAGNQSGNNAFISGWHLFSNLPLVAGASVRIDGVQFTTNIAGGNQTLLDHAVAAIGRTTNLSGGDWACAMLVDVSADAANRDQAVWDYVLARFGLADPANKLVLDAIPIPPKFAFSCHRRLRAAYGGPAIRVRRDSDSTELDIGFLGDFLDVSALLAFVGTGSGFVTKLYDQSGNGRDLQNTTPAAQPRIVNAGAIEAYPAGQPAMWFDGVDDRLASVVGPGLSGNPNFTVGCACLWLDPGMPFSFGANTDTTAGSRTTLYRGGTGLSTINKEHKSASRNFTPLADPGTAPRSYVMQHTAGGTTTSGVLYQDGVNLAGVGAGPSVSLVLGDNVIMLGSAASTTAYYMQGRINGFMLFDAVLAGSDMTALETELANHVR